MNFFFTGRRGRSSNKTLPAQALSRPTVPHTNSLPNAEYIPALPPRECPNLTQSPTQSTTDRTDNTQSPSITSAVEPPPTTQTTPLAILSSGGIPFWNPPTPSSRSPIGAVDLVQNFLRAHHNAPAANSYLSMIRKFYSVSEDEYQFMMHEFFPGNNTHVRVDYCSARQYLVIRFPGLPQGLMSRFHNQMRQALVLQGFLWPGWDADWLMSCGTSTLRVESHGTMHEIMPDVCLRLMGHKFPFLIVGVVDSLEYLDKLEQTRWILKRSKGKIRFAILIKLMRKTEQKTTEETESDDFESSLSEATAAPTKRPFRELGIGSSPLDKHKRARTEQSSLSPQSPPGQNEETCDNSTNTNDTTFSHFLDANIPSSPLSDVSDCVWTDLFPFVPEVGTVPTTLTNMPSTPPVVPRPPNPRAIFFAAYVTVLSTAATEGHREVTTVLDSVEFWPQLPRTEDVFSFGWEDMPVASLPDGMLGRRFTISFAPLNRYLQLFVNMGDSAWVAGHEEMLPRECSDEGDASSDGDENYFHCNSDGQIDGEKVGDYNTG